MTTHAEEACASGRGRKAVFRLLLVAVVILPLLLTEIALRLGGFGHPKEVEDPALGFHGDRPLFELNPSAERFEISTLRQDFFQPASFAARKTPGTFRIFCVGGSTVQGRPYSTETAFPRWLALGLTAAEPTRAWEVVNCGGVSYASHRLVPVLRELVQYEPDLFILYTGHNEFLEDRAFGPFKHARPGLRLGLLRHLRVVNVLRTAFRPGQGQDQPEASQAATNALPARLETRLDAANGWASYHRDEAWFANVTREFEGNLRRLLAIADHADVPVILIDPVSNLKDCPPIKVEAGPLSPKDRARFDELYALALVPDLGAQARKKILEEAVALDKRHAGAHYRLGQCRLALGDRAGAREAFVAARDEDVCPLRAPGAIHASIHRVAAGSNVTLLDAGELFAGLAEDGIPGGEVLVDHVHPNIRGHQQIAGTVLQHLMEVGTARPTDAWEDRRDAAYRAHLESLDPSYHVRAQQRLDRVGRWARGLEQPAGRQLLPPSGTE